MPKKTSKNSKKPAKKSSKTNVRSNKTSSFSSSKKNSSVLAKFPIMPLGDRVLLKEMSEVEMERTTASGIIIPDNSKDDFGGKRGKVLAVGNGRVDGGVRVPLDIAVGDTVLYQWGEKIKIDNEEYVIVREGEIIAILN